MPIFQFSMEEHTSKPEITDPSTSGDSFKLKLCVILASIAVALLVVLLSLELYIQNNLSNIILTSKGSFINNEEESEEKSSEPEEY